MTIVFAKRQKGITMEGSVSSINSRATAFKTILLTAWRGKLSNEDWENRIRKVLPRGVNGDVYDLADCLLRQALVGPVPNQLFISYLKHAVNCELVSHGAVLSSIAHQSTDIRTANLIVPNRTSSVICLLEFLKTFRDRISCKGSEVECLNLCHSLSQLLHWLLKCIQQSIEIMIGTNSTASSISQQQQQQFVPNMNLSALQTSAATASLASTNITNSSTNNNNSNNLSSVNIVNLAESTLGIIDLCTEAIHYFIDKPFTKSLLFISKIEYNQEFDEILKTVQAIQQRLSNCPSLQFIQEKLPHYKVLQQLNMTFNSKDMHPSVVAAQQLRCLQLHRIRSTQITSSSNFERKLQQSLVMHDSTTNYALFNSLYPLVALDAILRPARSHKLLAQQITTITNFNSAPINMTYCELIRACMIGLIDTDGTGAKLKWTFFTFLKMPKLLIELNKFIKKQQDSTDSYSYNQITNFVNDLKLAFERLCEYSPLLDEAEHKCNCDFFKCIVKELIKNDPSLIQLKNIDFRKFPAKRPNNNNNENFNGATRSEQVITSMLETFDVEQQPSDLYGIIVQLVSGKHFELSLSAAASTGRLQMFVKKLVQHNENNRVTNNDLADSLPCQALVFDITFLILTYIAQNYGPEVIGPEQQTTFNKWFYDSYNLSTRLNCPKQMLKNGNGDVVSNLIRQLMKPEGLIQMRSVDWRQVCLNMPNVISEILKAWTRGHLDDNQMRNVIERIKSQMCFMAVVAANWLQCHIRTLNEVDKIKPLTVLQSLTKPSQQAKHRSSLMCSIIRKIYFELAPKTSPANQSSANNNTSSTSNSLTDTDDALDESTYQSINDKFISILTTQEIFMANVKQCLNRGWIDHKSLISLNSLSKMIGGECFTNLIVEQILTSHESPSDLSRAVNITFGLFHLDIEACAFALLKDTIPSWLMGEKKQVLLNQPRAFALAHLTVMTIIEVYQNLTASQPTNSTRSDDKKILVNGIKQEPGLQKPILVDFDVGSGNVNGPQRDIKRIKLTHGPKEKDSNQDASNRLNKLNSCISDLMRLFKEIMSDPVMSQRTLFPVLFLQQTVACTREGSTVVTAHLQPEILLDIINLFSSELTFELVLAISNLSTKNSRTYAAKAMCQLAQVKESKHNQLVPSNAPNLSTKLSGQAGAPSSSGKNSVPTPMVIG